MFPFVTSRWGHESHDSMARGLETCALDVGMTLRSCIKILSSSPLVSFSSALLGSYGDAFNSVGMSQATLGLRAPDPAKGTSPFGIPLAAALGSVRCIPVTDKDFAGSDLWPAKSSFSYNPCQKRNAGFKRLPTARRIRSC